MKATGIWACGLLFSLAAAFLSGYKQVTGSWQGWNLKDEKEPGMKSYRERQFFMPQPRARLCLVHMPASSVPCIMSIHWCLLGTHMGAVHGETPAWEWDLSRVSVMVKHPRGSLLPTVGKCALFSWIATRLRAWLRVTSQGCEQMELVKVSFQTRPSFPTFTPNTSLLIGNKGAHQFGFSLLVMSVRMSHPDPTKTAVWADPDPGKGVIYSRLAIHQGSAADSFQEVKEGRGPGFILTF